jgi:hypothetical protein
MIPAGAPAGHKSVLGSLPRVVLNVVLDAGEVPSASDLSRCEDDIWGKGLF